MAGVLEYITYEILDLASKKSISDKSSKKTITPRDIMLAVKSDEEFKQFF